MWINSIFCRYFQENLKPRATFLSGARQPEEDFLHSWAMILNKFLGQIVSLRVKTLNNKNLVLPRHIKKKKRLTSGWKESLKNVGCLNSLLTSKVRTVTGTQIMIITGVRLLLSWFSNRMGTSVDDGARKSNKKLDQWQSGKLGTGSLV